MSDYLATTSILERLERERAALVSRLAHIPTVIQAQRPSPGRWSIAEVLEHLVRIETGVTKLLALKGQAPPSPDAPAPPAEAHGTPDFGARVRNRAERIEAPERVRPAGTQSAEEALAQLQLVRVGLLNAFATANPAALDTMTHAHPVFGPLTLRSWVSLPADHEARHAAQIGEIAEQLGVRQGAAV